MNRTYDDDGCDRPIDDIPDYYLNLSVDDDDAPYLPIPDSSDIPDDFFDDDDSPDNWSNPHDLN